MSGIALFATGDFIRVELKHPDLWGTRVGMLMGLIDDGKEGPVYAVVIREDGTLVFPHVTDIVVNWRYDAEKDAFHDLDAIGDPGS